MIIFTGLQGQIEESSFSGFYSVGIFEESSSAASTKDLMLLTGGRSVYRESELSEWGATARRIGTPSELCCLTALVPWVNSSLRIGELPLLFYGHTGEAHKREQKSGPPTQRGYHMASVLPFVVNKSDFDDDTTRIMGEAFDAACVGLQDTGQGE